MDRDKIMGKLTPMMQQYMDIKEQYKDCILFFRLGDFYEMFFDDAITASKEMEVTLTGKSCGLEERAPMCGVPYHAADTYISKLINKGYKVAICEQTEDPAAAKGIVKREVIRIVTPGTVIDNIMLDESENNYLASVYIDESIAGLAYCDISTGELAAGEYKDISDLINELIRIDVREVIINTMTKNSAASLVDSISTLSHAYVSAPDESYFIKDYAQEAIKRHFKVASFDGLGLGELDAAVRALGAMFCYLSETQKNSMEQLLSLRIIRTEGIMSLDRSAVKNLELTETLFEKNVKGSLLGILDKTKTAMGSRKLKKWIKEPLNLEAQINKRLDAVETLVIDVMMRNNIREALRGVYDIERLSGRIAAGNANARDMLSLRNSLTYLPDLKSDIMASDDELLRQIGENIDTLDAACERITSAIKEEPPISIKEGGIIKDGYSKELDDIKEASNGSISWIMGLENAERERTGIKKLKVGFNKVFGYYIEVSKAQLDNVPDDYIRKQTLVNAERFVTPKLKEMEILVLNAETNINNLEYQLFTELREFLKGFTAEVQKTADAIAVLDVLLSFAEVSSENGYIKPDVNDGDIISITEGRHPVIEQTVTGGTFVPNDTYIDRDSQSMLLITGPNMAGKSTYMRQTALIVLMAQMGCFVPADSAIIGVVDRIYTRIGASDNLTQGQSTFFVEMSELAYILNTATERSLVILDEIGRGTSTYDGLAIAWATVDALCSEKHRVRTLFATHYHELTALDETLKGLKNLNVSVSESGEDVVFLHKITQGTASRSYGINVAKLAGFPDYVLKAASAKLSELESSQETASAKLSELESSQEAASAKLSELESSTETVHGDTQCVNNRKENTQLDKTQCVSESCEVLQHDDSKFNDEQISFLMFSQHPAVDMLRSIDIMNITPAGAIDILEKLKKAVDEFS